jgi:glycosyltransferase involved in cell wall biosynthesis
MKILVASAFQADSRFAHAINTLKMADGFSRLGHQVTVVCRRPQVGDVSMAELREGYGLSDDLQVVQVRSRLFGLSLNEHRHFALQVARLARRLGTDFAYSRNYLAPVTLSRMGIPVVAESHAHPENRSEPLAQMVNALAEVRAFSKLVTIAPILKENFVRLGVPWHKIMVLPDAADLALFQRPKGFVRATSDKRARVVYAGHLYDYKGIPTILDAAALMPECDFVLVGGKPEDLQRHRQAIAERRLDNIELTGWLAHTQVPSHLWNADVLLLPPSAQHPSARWTSPVKMGEYLASGTPVVASRIPALEYWLDADRVCFINPDDGTDLAAGIRRVLGDAAYAASLSRRAGEFAQGLSYLERCRQILEAVEGP